MTPLVDRIAGWCLVTVAFALSLPVGAAISFYLVALAVSA